MKLDRIIQPPDKSRISVQRLQDYLQFSGISRSHGQEALRKTMPSMTSPSGSVDKRLGSLPWKLKVSPNRIEFSQEQLIQVNEDEFFCRPSDIREISVSSDGYLMAHLVGRSSREIIVPMTGSLSAGDADWLRETLSDLLAAVKSEQQSVAASRVGSLSSLDEGHLPGDCRVISSGARGELVIHHLPSVDTGQKVAVTVIYMIFGAAFGGPPLYYAALNAEQIRGLPLPHWAALLGIVIAIVFGISLKRKSIARRARARRGGPRDDLKKVGIRMLGFGCFAMIQLLIVLFVFRNLSELTETPLPVWLAALALIAGAGFVGYFALQTVWLLLGRTVLVATKQMMRIQKKVLIPFSSKEMHRSELQSIELMELIHVNDGKEVRYWGLDANLSDCAFRLLPKEISFDTADWLGRILSDWFGVTFIKAQESEAIRSRHYEELG